MPQDSVYSLVTDITEDYLGPAANRFVDRVVESHLHKQPSKLDAKDIPKLITWMRFAVGVLTDDPKTIEEYTQRLRAVASK